MLLRLLAGFMFPLMLLSAGWIHGQDYPNKPIRIATSQVGGGNDLLSRLIGKGISGPLGQPVIIENRPAGLEAELLATANPDGYTLVVGGSTLWLSELIQDKWRYKVFRDYVPITLATTSPLILTVNPSLPVNSVKELIALAKAKPGALNYGSGATGASSHLGPALFQAMADVDIVRIPFKGTGPAYNALISGEVQMMISNSGSAMPHVKSGRLKALAVTTAQPSPLVPGLPTVAASGLPGYESVVYEAVFAPAKTPLAIIKRLNQEIAKVLHSPEVKTWLLGRGVEPLGSSHDDAMSKIKSEMPRIGKVIKAAGIHAK
jgi:tripartite-type tricarboxylate transporter receptor subunit TctC